MTVPQQDHGRRFARALALHLAAFVLYLAMAVWLTWPLLPNLRTAVSDPGDPYLNTWIIDWDMWAALHDPANIYDANIFHPSRYALAFSENLFGIALVAFPFHLAGFTPLAVYNITLLLGFAFSGYGAWVLAREVTGSSAAAVVGGIFYAFVPFRWDHLSHLQHVWGGWLPILLCALFRLYRRPSWGNTAFFAFAFLLNALTNVHWFLFGSTAAALTALFLVAVRSAPDVRRFLLRLGVATAITLAVIVPVMIPYTKVSKIYQMKRDRLENMAGSAVWMDWLTPPVANAAWGGAEIRNRSMPERNLFPGIVVVLLALSGLFLTRREDVPGDETREVSPRDPDARLLRALDVASAALLVLTYTSIASGHVHASFGGRTVGWEGSYIPATFLVAVVLWRLWIRYPRVWGSGSLHGTIGSSRFSTPTLGALLWIAIGVVGSFGLNAFFHSFLFGVLSPFRAVRAPARWAMITYVGLAVIAAVGVLPWTRRGSRVRRAAVVLLLAVLLTWELRPGIISWYQAPSEPAPVYRWLKSVPIGGAVLELPLASDGMSESPYLLGATVHHRRIMNGASGFEPRFHQELAKSLARKPIDPLLLSGLEKAGCSLIVVHADELLFLSSSTRSWIASGIRQGKLTFVRRFDHETQGDYVFAVAKNEPLAAFWREPERPDPSGRTPTQTVADYLERNAPGYNHDTFGRLDWPAPGKGAWGDLVIRGWALSPAGIRKVDVLLQDGMMRVPARLTDRPDVTEKFPWYPRTRRAGFEAAFAARPGSIRLATDATIEITDGNGKVTRLAEVPFRWWRWSPGKPVGPGEWNPAELSMLLERIGAADAPALQRRIETGEVSIDSVLIDWSRGWSRLPDAEFIDKVYRTVFLRAPDGPGLQMYWDRLQAGIPRTRLIEVVTRSDEFRKRYGRGSW